MKEMAALAAEPPDFVFNLVESINNKESFVILSALLNMFSIPIQVILWKAMFITTSKVLTGKTLENAGINNPRKIHAI